MINPITGEPYFLPESADCYPIISEYSDKTIGRVGNRTLQYSGGFLGNWLSFGKREYDIVASGKVDWVHILKDDDVILKLTDKEFLKLGEHVPMKWGIYRIHKDRWHYNESHKQALQIRKRVREIPGPADGMAEAAG